MRAMCHHCGKRVISRPRHLCYPCYFDPAIRALTSTEVSRFDDRETPHPVRQPGEPEFRCLWCMRFLCEEPMRLCGECQGWYNRASADMPHNEEEGSRRPAQHHGRTKAEKGRF